MVRPSRPPTRIAENTIQVRERPGRQPAGEVDGDHRPVHGHDAGARERDQERGGIAVADDRLRLAPQRRQVECRHDALAAESAPGAEDGADVRIVEHALQVGSASGVRTREIAPSSQDGFAGDHPQPEALQDGDPGPEPRLLDRS
jgi:hypothetical protein